MNNFKPSLNSTIIKKDKTLIRLVFFLLTGCAVLFNLISGAPAFAQENSPTPTPASHSEYFSATAIELDDGTALQKVIINGPPDPPPGYSVERFSASLPKSNQESGSNSLTVPAYDWSFGCSATSAAMIAAYFDINGFPEIYTGPTNGGVMPLNNSVWPDWIDGCGDTSAQNPLSASHLGLDGRLIKGHVDDYWTCYESTADDPWIGNWTPHTPDDSTGDFMYTNQSSHGNIDGSTQFWGYDNANQLLCSELETLGGIYEIDGTLGFKNFYESRGYFVSECYYQATDNQYAGGFSFENFKAEIDAGQPVMLHVTGHTMVGVGYADPSTVYLHDTWDYNTHSMTWGGSYLGMPLYSVSVVHLASPEMDVQGNGQSIVDGDAIPSLTDDTDFGSINVSGGTAAHTFTIENSGDDDLNLTDSPEVQIGGTHASDFMVTSQPASPVAGSGGTTTFEITFDPSDIGLRQAEISIANDDPDEHPYNFSIQGTGEVTFTDVLPSHWAYDYIQALWDGGYTAGCSTTPLEYCPDQIMNRAMSAVFMLRGQFGSGYSPPAEPWDTFTDDWSLSDISWAEKWAEGMWEEGLSAGCLADPLMYCPRRELPRVEASVFALRMLHGVGYSPPPATVTLFADMTDPGYWGTKWAEQAFRDGLLPECGWQGSTPLFCPDDLVDRALGAYLIILAKNLTVAITLPQPALLNPGNGATLADDQPTLEWDEVSGVVLYNVQIAVSGNLGTIDLLENEWELASDICSGGTCSWQVGTAFVNDTYDWQVRGRDAALNLTPWAQIWNFTIDS